MSVAYLVKCERCLLLKGCVELALFGIKRACEDFDLSTGQAEDGLSVFCQCSTSAEKVYAPISASFVRLNMIAGKTACNRFRANLVWFRFIGLTIRSLNSSQRSSGLARRK